MKRLIPIAVLLGGFALSGCIYEYQHRTATTVTRTQNEDGTTTVTRTEVVREEVPAPSVYVAPYWGWYGYPYYYPYYGRPGFGFYYGGCYPHHH